MELTRGLATTSLNTPSQLIRKTSVPLYLNSDTGMTQTSHVRLNTGFQQMPTNRNAVSNPQLCAEFGSNNSAAQDMNPLPAGWEQSLTAEGEVYYINHVDKTTSWQDPRQGRSIQLQHGHQRPTYQPHLPTPASQKPRLLVPPNPRRPMSNEHIIRLELHEIQKLKERLYHEQEAITCREMMLKDLVSHSSSVSSSDRRQTVSDISSTGLSIPQIVQIVCSSGADSFLAQNATATDTHVRQNSTDSGLSGMSAGYSLPRTPDDYLSNLDEMDLQEETGNQYPNLRQQRSALSELRCGLNLDLTSLVTDNKDEHHQLLDTRDTAMIDAESFMPTLQDDISTELLTDADAQKIDSMLWL